MSGSPADRCKIPRAFWLAVEHVGVRPAALLRQARLPVTLHLNGQGLVSTAQFFALWRALEELTADPGLGIKLVESAETAVYPPSSLAAFHARDYRDGLSRLARFKRLCTPEQLHLSEQGGECSITWERIYATEAEPPIAVDVDFATLVELGRRGTGQRLTPVRVEFQRADPKSNAHRSYFECPVRYGQSRNVLILKSADLDRPFPGHNPELLELLTPALASALGEIQARSSIREQVKIVLKRSLASGRPELCDVAFDLGMSERTLQRRITDRARPSASCSSKHVRNWGGSCSPIPQPRRGRMLARLSRYKLLLPRFSGLGRRYAQAVARTQSGTRRTPGGPRRLRALASSGREDSDPVSVGGCRHAGDGLSRRAGLWRLRRAFRFDEFRHFAIDNRRKDRRDGSPVGVAVHHERRNGDDVAGAGLDLLGTAVAQTPDRQVSFENAEHLGARMRMFRRPAAGRHCDVEDIEPVSADPKLTLDTVAKDEKSLRVLGMHFHK